MTVFDNLIGQNTSHQCQVTKLFPVTKLGSAFLTWSKMVFANLFTRFISLVLSSTILCNREISALQEIQKLYVKDNLMYVKDDGVLIKFKHVSSSVEK